MPQNTDHAANIQSDHSPDTLKFPDICLTMCGTHAVLQLLIVALVFSRLDYGSATLAGLPSQLMDRLQSVQNAAFS